MENIQDKEKNQRIFESQNLIGQFESRLENEKRQNILEIERRRKSERDLVNQISREKYHLSCYENNMEPDNNKIMTRAQFDRCSPQEQMNHAKSMGAGSLHIID